MNKQKVKVFPDHISTGLWDHETGASLNTFNLCFTLDKVDFIALQYWHEIWEFFIDSDRASKTYIKRWNEDGKKMVEEWNKKQDKVEFIYEETEKWRFDE